MLLYLLLLFIYSDQSPADDPKQKIHLLIEKIRMEVRGDTTHLNAFIFWSFVINILKCVIVNF